jgi:methionine biosynthesis protein MetW
MNHIRSEDLVERRIRGALEQSDAEEAGETGDLLILDATSDPAALARVATAGRDPLTRFARRVLYRVLFPLHEQQRKYAEANARIVLQLTSRVRLLERALGADPGWPLAPREDADLLAVKAAVREDSEAIRRQLGPLVEHFGAHAPVLDLACGKGELLELLRDAGIDATGVDRDSVMVDHCRERGLAVNVDDGIAALGAAGDASLGGLAATRAIEYLTPRDVVTLVALAAEKLRPGGLLVVESLNPRSSEALAGFYRDLAGVRPYDPAAVSSLLERQGFVEVEMQLSGAGQDASAGAGETPPRYVVRGVKPSR